ncbi:MAG: hypothetical protein II822_08900 [Prevotella sp.]|nr:hypothetical protein [Prevotella sp.]
MKKLFTFIVMALMAVGANAQTKLKLGGQAENSSWSWGWTQTLSAQVNLAFTTQWGEFNLATTGLTEGATYKLVVAEANEKINLRINTSGDPQYIAVNATELTGTIPAGATKIELQATEANLDLNVVSFEINGVQTTYSTNWGVAMYGGIYTTAQWAELFLIGAAKSEPQQITITFSEAVPADALQLKVYKTDGTEGYPAIPAGTEAVITVEDAAMAISLQAKDAYTIKIAGATTGPASSVNAVKTVQQSGVRYNLAGQKVSESYKGVVIENGRKLIQK